MIGEFIARLKKGLTVSEDNTNRNGGVPGAHHDAGTAAEEGAR